MYDIIVLGAGPAGSYLAHKAARLGYNVVVLERQARVGGKTCCTGIISKECHDMLAPDRSLTLRQASSANLFAPSGKSVRVHRDNIQAHIIDRPALDYTLATKAQEEGAQYLLSVNAKDISIGKGSVQVKASAHDRPQAFEARVVAITTGFGSKLPQRLGLGDINHFALGAQVEVASSGIDEVEVFLDQELAPGFFAWLVPTSGNKAKVGLLSQHSPHVYLEILLSKLQRQGKIIPAEADISHSGIPLKPLPKTYGDRVIVIGDAAGQVKPTTGGGIYYGLLCAEIAANTLHQAFMADDLSAKQLSRYQKEWHKRLGKELKIDYWARRFYEKLDNQQIDHIFHIIKSNGIHESILASPDVSFDWHSNVILDAIKHKSLQRVVQRFNIITPLTNSAAKRHRRKDE
ncbi:MAG TPA: NAD(P)/FAD-dependent oxidoreductase [Dehalococcoidia bacterium]|nr:NAD(P)/FAD-dependent oxidoreductase [Dehalococcoidia bacterium]